MPEPETTGLHAVTPRLPPWLARAVVPLPLAPLQPALALLLARIGRAHPDLYDRLGEHAQKRFGIDPIDLPFAFVLEPKPRRPLARAVRELPAGLDASIPSAVVTASASNAARVTSRHMPMLTQR